VSPLSVCGLLFTGLFLTGATLLSVCGLAGRRSVPVVVVTLLGGAGVFAVLIVGVVLRMPGSTLGHRAGPLVTWGQLAAAAGQAPGWVWLAPVVLLAAGWVVQCAAWSRQARHPRGFADAVPSEAPVGAAPLSMSVSGWLVAYTLCCAAGYAGWAMYQAATSLGVTG
jgi:hypothetical protein